ncbi:MAG: hypothetical protein E3J47_05725 [Candidatus Stahlbacteria bacterium]|nr:MAG: hypothetical protein E3J47_05725 [Candidatus Stahlbacteria bacterium]
MKTLKEKIAHVTEQHEIEKQNNLRDEAIHIGNLKNIGSGDSIFVYYGNFYTVPRMFTINLVDFSNNVIYIHMHARDTIQRFHMYNCREWKLDSKKPKESGTTKEENWRLADYNFIDIVEYPIINVKYKEKLTPECIPSNFLCYDVKKKNTCKFLSYATGYYRCNFLHETLFETKGSFLYELNLKRCRGKNT